MEPLIALMVGALYATGCYMVLKRSLFDLVMGLCLFSYGANLLLFINGGLTRRQAPIISKGITAESVPTDPLAQALVLTAIVISFGLLAFCLALFFKTHKELGTDDLGALEEVR